MDAHAEVARIGRVNVRAGVSALRVALVVRAGPGIAALAEDRPLHVPLALREQVEITRRHRQALRGQRLDERLLVHGNPVEVEPEEHEPENALRPGEARLHGERLQGLASLRHGQGELPAALDDLRKPLELDAADAGAEVVEVQVERGDDIGLRVRQSERLPAVGVAPRLPVKVLVLDEHRPPLAAGRVVLSEHRRERADVADRSDVAALVLRAVRLGAVLDDRDVSGPRDLHDGVHVGRQARDVRDDNRARALVDPRLDLLRSHVVGTRRAVGGHGDAVHQRHRHHTALVGAGRNDHFRERLNFQEAERDVNRARPGVDRVRVTAAEEP